MASSPEGKLVLANDNVMQAVHASLFAGTVKCRRDIRKQVVCISLLAKANELQVMHGCLLARDCTVQVAHNCLLAKDDALQVMHLSLLAKHDGVQVMHAAC